MAFPRDPHRGRLYQDHVIFDYSADGGLVFRNLAVHRHRVKDGVSTILFDPSGRFAILRVEERFGLIDDSIFDTGDDGHLFRR